MDRKQMCVANVKYKKPTASDSKKAKGLLRYLTYRDSRDGHIKQASGQERWVDHGLGHTVGEIAEACDRYQGEHVLAFTLVFNPNPDLITMVPEQRRARFVRELTETTLDHFFEARGLGSGLEYSYVTHHRQSEDPETPGLPDPHTHVILPGTYFDEDEGQRVPLFFSQNRQVDHIEMLHRVTENQMADLIERYVGPEWEQRYDNLQAIREQQRTVVQNEPGGQVIGEAGRAWPVWAGVRRTTEDLSAAGTYRYFPTEAGDEPRLAFRPLLLNMPHDMADAVADMFTAHLHLYPDPTLKKLESFSERLCADLKDGGTSALSELGLERPIAPDHGLSLDL